MSIWQQFLSRFNPGRSARVTFTVDDSTARELRELAVREQRPVDELAGDLLREGVAGRRQSGVMLQRWEKLTPREQQVAALICLNYTNRQAAVHLGISSETIKTHVAKVLAKFELKSKAELRQALAGWDFDAWEKLPPEG